MALGKRVGNASTATDSAACSPRLTLHAFSGRAANCDRDYGREWNRSLSLPLQIEVPMQMLLNYAVCQSRGFVSDRCRLCLHLAGRRP